MATKPRPSKLAEYEKTIDQKRYSTRVKQSMQTQTILSLCFNITAVTTISKEVVIFGTKMYSNICVLIQKQFALTKNAYHS